LADRGLLVEAEILCREHIAKNKLDPDAYFLLGILLLGLKRHAEAEGCLNKTLFLKPDHSDALLRLAAIKEGRGDSRGAELCRRRARRGEALNG
jgi:chemotaxis protein methyltransferase WspC